jgi:hypothetical protein
MSFVQICGAFFGTGSLLFLWLIVAVGVDDIVVREGPCSRDWAYWTAQGFVLLMTLSLLGMGWGLII